MIVCLTACGPRGVVTIVPEARSVGTIEPVFIGTMRDDDPETGERFSRVRTHELRFARVDVSVPPDRAPGTITWPRPGRTPDLTKDFVAAGETVFPDSRAFTSSLRAELDASGRQREVVVFVHGFNTTYAEGTYRFAQLGHDLGINAALVHFSWPSRGNPLAYVHDQDSVQFSRDGLERLLGEVKAAGAKRILIIGHSIGSQLVMEALRQMAIGRRDDLLDVISGVVLMSPDIDVDVFNEQARRIGTLPQPFVVFTSTRDRALRLSARLTGQPGRLGNLESPSQVSGVNVTLVDTSAFSVGEGHFNVGNSAALLALFNNISAVDAAFANETSSRLDLLNGVVLTAQNATKIIMSPVEALAD